MSVAFSTLVIVLFALMPGFLFEHFLYSGKMARTRATTATLTDLAEAVFLSLPVHFVALFALHLLTSLGRSGVVCRLTSHLPEVVLPLARPILQPPKVDYRLFLHALAGQFTATKTGDVLDGIADSVASYSVAIAAYLLLVAAVAFLLGQFLGFLVLAFPIFEQFLPFRNRWFYLFFEPGRQRISACDASVLTKTSTESRLLLYDGDIDDFTVDEKSALTEIRLRRPRRAFLKTQLPTEKEPAGFFERILARIQESPNPQAEQAEDVAWWPLEQDTLVIPGDQIANLSLRHIVFWRPWLIAGQAELLLKADKTKETIDLRRTTRWPRRLATYLHREPQSLFIIPTTGGKPQAQAQVDGWKVTINREPQIPLADPLPEIQFRVLGTYRGVKDVRETKADNLLFSVLGWLLDRSAARIERVIQPG